MLRIKNPLFYYIQYAGSSLSNYLFMNIAMQFRTLYFSLYNSNTSSHCFSFQLCRIHIDFISGLNRLMRV